MRKWIFLFMVSAASSMQHADAQANLIPQWDQRYGGTGTDFLGGFVLTSDGGYLLGGFSFSGAGGDKSQPGWNTSQRPDYWAVRADSAGTKLWDKDFGGTADDYLHAVIQTSDGGFLLAGTSNSGISGNKTHPGYGLLDYWILKTDSAGNKLWDKTFGGPDMDDLHSVVQSADGGFLLGGFSRSAAGGVKTQPTWGNYDYWIVKTDSLGNFLWDRDIGGPDYESLSAIICTNDSGFLIAGYSNSPAGGNKSAPSWGGTDYWIVKVDSSGIAQWDKDFGGTADDNLTCIGAAGNGFVLAGSSKSATGGDKTQSCWGASDYWVVNVDSLGSKLWDKDFGGTGVEDGVGSVFRTIDGGYFVIGNSFSPVSGNKTENNLGNSQAWAVKTDSLGNLVWDKTVFTFPDQKIVPYALQTSEGCYTFAESTMGEIAGYKSQSNRDSTNGSFDYWMIRFCESTTILASFTSFPFVCPGTCTDFFNASVNATSFLWFFPGAIPSSSTDVNPTGICYNQPGSYDVTLIASNSMTSDTLTLINFITVYPLSPPQSIQQTGDTLISNQGFVTYQWFFNGDSITGATDYLYVASQSGNYNVVCTDSNGCEVEAGIFNVLAGVSTVDGPLSTVVVPNPVYDEFTVHSSQFTEKPIEISIYNVLGEKVYQEAVDRLPAGQAGRPWTVDCRPFPSGIYWILATDGTTILRSKFVKQ